MKIRVTAINCINILKLFLRLSKILWHNINSDNLSIGCSKMRGVIKKNLFFAPEIFRGEDVLNSEQKRHFASDTPFFATAANICSNSNCFACLVRVFVWNFSPLQFTFVE